MLYDSRKYYYRKYSYCVLYEIFWNFISTLEMFWDFISMAKISRYYVHLTNASIYTTNTIYRRIDQLLDLRKAHRFQKQKVLRYFPNRRFGITFDCSTRIWISWRGGASRTKEIRSRAVVVYYEAAWKFKSTANQNSISIHWNGAEWINSQRRERSKPRWKAAAKLNRDFLFQWIRRSKARSSWSSFRRG